MSTLSGEVTLLLSFLLPSHLKSTLIRICSPRSKRRPNLWKSCIVQESIQRVIKVVSLCKNGRKIWQCALYLNDDFKVIFINFLSGPGRSKLTTSLINVSLKFPTLISEICQYFLLKKCEKLLQCKIYQCIWL